MFIKLYFYFISDLILLILFVIVFGIDYTYFPANNIIYQILMAWTASNESVPFPEGLFPLLY